VYNAGWRRELVKVQRVQNKVSMGPSTYEAAHRPALNISILSLYVMHEQLLWEKYVQRRRSIARECREAFSGEASTPASVSGGAGAAAGSTLATRSIPQFLRSPSSRVSRTSTLANEMWLLHGTPE
jgi:hypothetical protein